MLCMHIYLSWPAVSHTESFTFVVPTVMVFSRYDACNVEICLSSYSPLMYLFDGERAAVMAPPLVAFENRKNKIHT